MAVESGHSIMKCRSCGLVQVRPLPVEMEAGNTACWQTDLDNPAVHRSRKGDTSVYKSELTAYARSPGKHSTE